jgi:site-specific recombinase XerD
VGSSLACYTGLRHSDWGTFNAEAMYKDNLLRLRAHKNKMDIVIPVGPSLKKLIELTKTVPKSLSNQKCNVHLKAVRSIAELDKKITCHTARHTAGNLFAASGLNISVVAKLLAISENTAKVYFHYSGTDITKLASVLKTI